MKKRNTIIIITLIITSFTFSLFVGCKKNSSTLLVQNESKETIKEKKVRAPFTKFSSSRVRGRSFPTAGNGCTGAHTVYSYCFRFDNTTYNYYGINNQYPMNIYICSGGTIIKHLSLTWPYNQSVSGSFTVCGPLLPYPNIAFATSPYAITSYTYISPCGVNIVGGGSTPIPTCNLNMTCP